MLPKRIDDRAAFHNSTADEFLARDEELVFEARTLLGLLDFEFFRVAWRNWHGGEPDDRRLEPGFVTFLFKQLAPDYVRHFARLVFAAGGGRPARSGGIRGRGRTGGGAGVNLPARRVRLVQLLGRHGPVADYCVLTPSAPGPGAVHAEMNGT